jgi:TRAP-type C4-dicarboxylate transport system permease small subunit
MSQKAPKILLYYVGLFLIIAGVIAILGQIYNIYVLPPKKQISLDLFNYTIAGLLILGIIFTVWGKLKGG